MVKTVEITNFRGFAHFEVKDLARINLIVGDNAVGKTALLEAIFLTLSGNAEKGLSLKRWRGLDVAFQSGSADSVADAIYADLFHDPKSLKSISIKLTGNGFENRQLTIARTSGDIFVPTKGEEPSGNRHQRRANKKISRQKLSTQEMTTVPIALTWTDEQGKEYISRAALSPQGLKFAGTGEQIPLNYMFAAQIAVPIEEAAAQFSNLRLNRQADKFRKGFLSVFDWITDVSVETIGGSPTILADVPWAKNLLPLPALSGGTTRAASILLALTFRPNVVVLVDEIESGIYHARQERFAKALVEMARDNEAQLIMTSHSEEWLEKFLNVSPSQTEDIAFWRMERVKHGPPQIRRFTVAEFRSGMAAGEMR